MLKNTVILATISFLILPWAMTEKVYADFSATDGTYFCNVNDLTVEKSGYSYLIFQENRYWASETPEDIATNILNGNYSKMLDDLGRTYHCLKDNGINPDSVDTMPSYLIIGLNLAKEQNPEKFAEVAPNFSNYVPVPEFGSFAALMIVISVIGVIVISRKF